jgi:hypothetical protein
MPLSSEIRSRTPFILFGLILGLIAGFVLNALWYLFLALVLGWRDSAPEWYFPIQGTVRTLIFVGAVVCYLVGNQVVYVRAKRRGRI